MVEADLVDLLCDSTQRCSGSIKPLSLRCASFDFARQTHHQRYHIYKATLSRVEGRSVVLVKLRIYL